MWKTEQCLKNWRTIHRNAKILHRIKSEILFVQNTRKKHSCHFRLTVNYDIYLFKESKTFRQSANYKILKLSQDGKLAFSSRKNLTKRPFSLALFNFKKWLASNRKRIFMFCYCSGSILGSEKDSIVIGGVCESVFLLCGESHVGTKKVKSAWRMLMILTRRTPYVSGVVWEVKQES